MASAARPSPEIGLAGSTYLGQAMAAAAAGDRVRAVEALTAISGADWDAIKARGSDPLTAGILALTPDPDDFDRAVEQALEVVSGTTWTPSAGRGWRA